MFTRTNMGRTFIATALMVASLLMLPVAMCNIPKKSLVVKVVANYRPPASFSFKQQSYRAGSSLTLSCEVVGAESDDTGLLYEWRSSCGGNCFVRSGSTKSVSTQYLHSYDKGVHTCVVHDRGGCTGNASITVNVIGAGIYVESPKNEVLPNNSLIVETGSYHPRIPHFRGLSGSNKSYVGQLIDPHGTDVTTSITDPFLISLGSSFEPGMMRVRSFRSLQRSEVGVYTYRTPDESGKIIDVNFGLYTSTLSRRPTVTKLDASLGGKIPFLLSCTSQHSPPTKVIWEKDGQQLHLNGSGYKLTQVLVNRITSTYISTLSMDGVLDDVVGEYSCTVVNSLGSSNTRNTTISPITITGHESPIIVGLSGEINCSTILNASKLEWRLVGIGKGEPVEETDQGQSLVLSLTPEATELNGAKLTCRVTTVNHKVFEATVTVTIKELDNVVSIEGSSEAIAVGSNATLMCIVKSDFAPSLQWLDKSGNLVTSSGDNVWTEQQYTIGRVTYMRLVIKPVKSSHGGSYACKSVIGYPPSTNSTSKKVLIKLSPKLVTLEQLPTGQHFTGQPLTLTCWTHLNDSIDTSVQVTHSWTGPSGAVRTDSRRRVTGVSFSDGSFSSSLIFYSLQTSDSGRYTCQSTVQPAPRDSVVEYISSSTPKTTSIDVSAVLQVDIAILYSSPDPEYSPPNYRAASSVTLTCVATGVSGYASYRWSSTCRSCFASGSSRSSISKTYLVVADDGVHTCTVTDRSGNTGSTNITMNIEGIGIYVSSSKGTGSGLSIGVQPNNSYAIVDTGYSSTTTRFSMYCCSSSTNSTGKIIFPNGVTRSSGRYSQYDSITRYSTTSSLAGCIQFSYSRSYRWYYRTYLSLSYPGIYTCSFDNKFSSIALYSKGTTVPKASMISLQRSSWSVIYPWSLRITTSIRYSPPTNIIWYRDDVPIDTARSNVAVTTYVTSRSSSYYDVSMALTDTPDNLVGDYSISLSNMTDSNNDTYVSVVGIQISCNSTRFLVGQPVTCTCSSDLKPTLIEWFKTGQSTSICSQSIITNGRSESGSSDLLITPTTEDHGKVFKCVTTTPYGSQNATIKLHVEVPSSWSTVSIEPSSDDPAVHNSNYSLTCIVTSVPGINLPVSVQWLFQNGTVINSDGSKTIRNLGVANYTTTTLLSTSCQPSLSYSKSSVSLSFEPVHNYDGDTYICRASVSVSWMTLQPQRVAKSAVMSVTTQAKFQLKIYPVTHCATWDVQNGQELEKSIKKNLEEAVSSLCNCPFKSTAIHSGEFNCQPNTCESDDKCGPSSSAIGPVTYRATINGTSDLLTADQILDYIDIWREDTGTLLHKNMFRMGVQGKKKCALKIDSFNNKGC